VAAALTGCDLDVEYPTVVDASTFDPTTDASTLAFSAQTNFHQAMSSVVPFSAFFSQEAWVGAVRQETNDIGRRVMTAGTSDVNNALWDPIQQAIATNELAIEVLAGGEADPSVHLARVYVNAGFALDLLAQHFCTGVIRVGPPLTPEQVLDTALTRFSRAVEVGTAVGTAEATAIVDAANVGLARAYLQLGRHADAAGAAASVPADFVYSTRTVDDPSNRGLANGVFTFDLGALIVVPDTYRNLADPRVPWIDGGRPAQDTQLQYYQQQKYPGYASPIRIASGLEARYIAAEAALQTGDSDPALDLIAEQRAANGQPAFGGGTAEAILAELMDQRAREFWLEAKHTGDRIRNPDATPYVGDPGDTFYKPTQGEYGGASCMPVPLAESDTNPNFP
jgi:hypothetical protein